MNELQEFVKLKAEVAVFVAPTKSIVVTNADQGKTALSVVKEVKSYSKRIEDVRKALVGPLNEKVKEINAFAKEISIPLDQAEIHIKNELLKFERELERIRREEMAKAEAERRRLQAEADAMAAAEREAAEAVAMFSKPEHAPLQMAVLEAESAQKANEIQKAHVQAVAAIESNKVSGTSKVWTFRISDLEKIPTAFMSVNETAIRTAIREGRREIPGVEIFQETRMSVR